MQYEIHLTAVGLAKLAAASLGGAPITLTQMAVGDGAGNPISTDPLPLVLVNEVHRDQINSLYLHPTDSTMMMAELVIAADVGGFAIRELAVLDSDGDTFAIGAFPATVKPTSIEGATVDMIINAAIKVSDTALIELLIDTSIVAATRPWVLSTITPGYLIPGGNTGQILKKASNLDGVFVWGDQDTATNIIVDVVQDSFTAAAGQSIFPLVNCTTDGVSCYVEGSREENFTVVSVSPPTIQLSRTLTDGTKLVFVQNEPNTPLQLRKLVSGRGYFVGQQ